MSETTKIKLLAGIPDDDNREYLPERLKESEIVVNENGNNSQVYPANLKEMKACLIDAPGFFHARRDYDGVGTVHLYFMVACGGQRGIYCGLPKCAPAQILADRV